MPGHDLEQQHQSTHPFPLGMPAGGQLGRHQLGAVPGVLPLQSLQARLCLGPGLASHVGQCFNGCSGRRRGPMTHFGQGNVGIHGRQQGIQPVGVNTHDGPAEAIQASSA